VRSFDLRLKRLSYAASKISRARRVRIKSRKCFETQIRQWTLHKSAGKLGERRVILTERYKKQIFLRTLECLQNFSECVFTFKGTSRLSVRRVRLIIAELAGKIVLLVALTHQR